MSCIYGPHQFGTEDQGWVAHFLIRAMAGEPITLYGDGKQVRDMLFVEDLVDAFLLAQAHIDESRGQAFNIGGGPANTISLLELSRMMRDVSGERPPFEYEDWRAGDQRYYVSDTRRFEDVTGWRPRSACATASRRSAQWLVESATGWPTAFTRAALEEGCDEDRSGQSALEL